MWISKPLPNSWWDRSTVRGIGCEALFVLLSKNQGSIITWDPWVIRAHLSLRSYFETSFWFIMVCVHVQACVFVYYACQCIYVCICIYVHMHVCLTTIILLWQSRLMPPQSVILLFNFHCDFNHTEFLNFIFVWIFIQLFWGFALPFKFWLPDSHIAALTPAAWLGECLKTWPLKRSLGQPEVGSGQTDLQSLKKLGHSHAHRDDAVSCGGNILKGIPKPGLLMGGSGNSTSGPLRGSFSC